MPTAQTVLFDFDYTLADSSAAVVECMNVAFEAMGLAKAPEEAICRTIGLSLPEALVSLAGEAHRHRSQEFRSHFRRRSDQIMVDWTRLYPAVPHVLASLRDCGLRLGIVSTKNRHRIEAVLGRERLLERFDVIVGGEDVAEYKPDPEGLLLALDRLGSSPQQTAYVGDSTTDAETARRARVPFVAVLSGTTQRDEFAAYQPRHVLETVVEVPPLFHC